MLLAEAYYIPVHWALAVVVGVLLLAVLASLIYPVPTASVSAPDDFPREV
jgi:hypothetical protein